LASEDKIINYNIIGPVCPDYSYIINKNGSYRYTFNYIGGGVGLVAKKCISSINILKELSEDLNRNKLKLDYKILIGDFEVLNQDTLNKLNESKYNFIEKIKLSRLLIQNSSGVDTYLMSSLCNGLETWSYQINYIKHNYGLNSFNDLSEFMPRVNHKRNLISRIPLYKKWFGNKIDIKEIFFNQTIEYMLIGLLTQSKYGKNCAILASDHSAMRCYYKGIADIPIISSSEKY
tara:strand:- start:1491 stop:2189 length:699 start_codon:yes stop_codon:yes gene_type:complete